MRSEGVTQESLRRMADRVAAKGFGYEDRVRPVLEAAFAPYGDEVEDTSGTPGLDGKKGDFTVTLNAETRASPAVTGAWSSWSRSMAGLRRW